VVDPVALNDILIAVMAGALVVLFGALYAVTFAFGRLYRKPSLILAAYGFFLLLAACVFVLSGALRLSGLWEILLVLLLAGYFVAPQMIWRLSLATHADEAEGSAP
jgi:hypothetical protein